MERIAMQSDHDGGLVADFGRIAEARGRGRLSAIAHRMRAACPDPSAASAAERSASRAGREDVVGSAPRAFLQPGLLADRLAHEAEELSLVSGQHRGLFARSGAQIAQLASDVNRVCLSLVELAFQLSVAAATGILFAFLIHAISF